MNAKSEKPSFIIRETSPTDMRWIKTLIEERWGAQTIVVHNTVYFPYLFPGFIAIAEEHNLGLITYRISGSACEIITLNSLEEKVGIGSSLVEAVRTKAHQRGCKRLWLITTNDNVRAQDFYKKRGFSVKAVHAGAVDAARKIKPQIPLVGENGIPIHDEIEMELNLD